jgi:hypothetical protein
MLILRKIILGGIGLLSIYLLIILWVNKKIDVKYDHFYSIVIENYYSDFEKTCKLYKTISIDSLNVNCSFRLKTGPVKQQF